MPLVDDKMVSVSQTDDEVKIVISVTKPSNSRPVAVVLNNFVKFNCPPVYFESFLWGDVDEKNSVCRLLPKEARIILKKKEPGMWPNILEKVPRQEALKKKMELTDLLIERTQKEDKERSEQLDSEKKEKLQFQIDREMSVHDKIKEFNKVCIAETLTATDKKTEIVAVNAEVKGDSQSSGEAEKKEPCRVFKYVPANTNNLRKSGKIQITFSDFKAPTPKRESQEQARNVPAPNITIY